MDLINVLLGGLVQLVRHGTFDNNALPVVTVLAKNNSGGARSRGEVVVLDRANSTKGQLYFTTTTTANDEDVLGMVYETIQSGAIGKVQVFGPTHSLKVNGTTDIARGDLLGTYTSAGIAQKTTFAGAFATAFEAYATNDSSGVVDALLHNLAMLGVLHEAAHVAHDTIWDAKGDLVAGTGADTAAKVTVGANDTILMADSAEAAGVKWVAPAAPVAVGTANAEGSSDDFARASHVHAHEAAHINHDTTWAAKGDLIVGTANDTAAVLTVGTNDYVLTAASGEATGLKWAAVASGLTTASATLGANVTLTTAGTYYDGPSVSCAAGDWMFVTVVSCQDNTGVAEFNTKLWDGTTIYASPTVYGAAAGLTEQIVAIAKVTLASTTTVKMSVTNSTRNGGTIRADGAGGGGNNASWLLGWKVA